MLVFYLAALDSDDDKNKFEYIYRKYYRFMLHTAAGIIKNSSLAEDAVHETFVQLLRGIDTLRIDNERALKSYLYMVTRERSIDFLRKWERRRGAQPDYESLAAALDNYVEPEEVALTNLQLDKAIALLDEMPLIYRQTLVLRVKCCSSVRNSGAGTFKSCSLRLLPKRFQQHGPGAVDAGLDVGLARIGDFGNLADGIAVALPP